MKRLLGHSFWIAPLVAMAGFVSYFLFFVRYPALRDFPWVNLPLVLAALALAVGGLLHSWKRSSVGLRFLHLGAVGFSLFIGATLAVYVFWLSYQMPKAQPMVAPSPDFSLPSAQGKTVSLSDFENKRVLISFYRGYW